MRLRAWWSIPEIIMIPVAHTVSRRINLSKPIGLSAPPRNISLPIGRKRPICSWWAPVIPMYPRRRLWPISMHSWKSSAPKNRSLPIRNPRIPNRLIRSLLILNLPIPSRRSRTVSRQTWILMQQQLNISRSCLMGILYMSVFGIWPFALHMMNPMMQICSPCSTVASLVKNPSLRKPRS